MKPMPNEFMPGVKTERRREVIRHAGEAIHKMPGLDVVHFYIPEPLPLVSWEACEAPAKMCTPVCTASRERGYINVSPSFRLRMVARLFDARDNDTFWLDESGGVWKEDTRDDETYRKYEQK
jgi:hypothetical protein